MAHGFNNFMGNKDFHPGSFRNLKKVWEAEQKLQMEEKRQEELRLQYMKEQEQFQTKELMGKGNPMGFMYEPPPSFAAKDKETKEDGSGETEGEPKLKFDWQKEDKAPPRESYAKDMNITDQPFGIEVRNVKCVKCGKMGHVNTDRECPLFGKRKEGGDNDTPFEYPIITNWDALDDGLEFKQCVKDRVVNDKDPLQQYVVSDDETEMLDLLAQFSPKQRKKILKKLSSKGNNGDESGKSDKKRKRKHKKDKKSETSDKRKRTKHKHAEGSSSHGQKKRSRYRDSDSDSSDTSTSSNDVWVESSDNRNKHHKTDRKRHKERKK